MGAPEVAAVGAQESDAAAVAPQMSYADFQRWKQQKVLRPVSLGLPFFFSLAAVCTGSELLVVSSGRLGLLIFYSKCKSFTIEDDSDSVARSDSLFTFYGCLLWHLSELFGR
jgi:hypothetical protein